MNKACIYMVFLWLITGISTNLYAADNSVYTVINSSLLEAMKADRVPVVGYAIINQNKVVYANTLSIDPNILPTVHSLFQAASISKAVAAYTALRLVSNNQLALDEPVNNYLISWKIPIAPYPENTSVTLREILSMTSGLSVAGFSGYSQGQTLPTAIQILNGQAPANNLPIKIFYRPGSRYYYSGGGYQVLEQLIADATRQPFIKVATQLVLAPIGMQDSTYTVPISTQDKAQIIPGFLANGQEVENGWKNYPIPSAGGLWSTPTDIAKFALAFAQKSYLSPVVAAQVFTRQGISSFGLGVVVNGKGENLNFRKAGHNTGYISQLIVFPEQGKGLVIMTDSENGEYIINYLIPVMAHYFNWPTYFPYYGENFPIPNYV